MEIPTEKTIKLSQCERFYEGLKQLAAECGCTSVDYALLGPLKIYFNDGSNIGILGLFFEAGLIDKNTYNEQYKRWQ